MRGGREQSEKIITMYFAIHIVKEVEEGSDMNEKQIKMDIFFH